MAAPRTRAVPFWLIGVLVAVALLTVAAVTAMAIENHQQAVKYQARAQQSALERADALQAADDQAVAQKRADAREQAAKEQAAKEQAKRLAAKRLQAKKQAAKKLAAKKRADRLDPGKTPGAKKKPGRKHGVVRHLLTAKVTVPNINRALVTQIGGYPGQPLSDFSTPQLQKLHRLLESLSRGETYPCPRGSGVGYGHIIVGGRVTVHNGRGAVVATARLAGGFINSHGCTFSFKAHLPDADFYQVTVGRRNAFTFTRASIAARGWNVAARL